MLRKKITPIINPTIAAAEAAYGAAVKAELGQLKAAIDESREKKKHSMQVAIAVHDAECTALARASKAAIAQANAIRAEAISRAMDEEDAQQ